MTASETNPADPGPARPARGRRGLLVAIAALVLAAIIAGHRLIPNVAGIGSMVDSGVPFLGVGIPLLALAALLRRSRLALLAVLVPTLVWAGLFGTAWLPSGAGGDPTFRVASQNLRVDNPAPVATVTTLAGTDPDLIGLQEVGGDSRESVARALRDRYPYQVAESTVALWSRFPVREHVGVDTGLGWNRALRAVVETPRGDVAVYVVHLGSARAGDTATRDRTVAALAATLRREPAPRLIVLGDLNTASTDRAMAPLTDLLSDAQADAGRGLGFTWPASMPVTRPDHVLYRGLTAASANVLRTPASDHRAVTAGFR
ncbi:endonuclease/exonuclease/phosphatase family protein [Micromonospora sp. NPDC050397]|uniref:endonuclease/exonuclease/phosphatase family protein n=1 Tax=Micromonospora sp. NPDC050397 TaxID=3364279 RepID=UPI00384D181E